MSAIFYPLNHRIAWAKSRPQLTSFFIVFASFTVTLFMLPFPLIQDVTVKFMLSTLMISALGFILSCLFKLPAWWIVINTSFPIGVAIFYRWHISPSIYLALFLILLSIYWTTFISRVPYYPSTQDVWEKVSEQFPVDRKINVLEIGSGLGGFCRHLSKKYPLGTFLGLENAPVPWLLSIFLAKFQNVRCDFKRKDYQTVDFSKFDVIYAFLSPAVMDSLCMQAKKQLHAQAVIISYMFEWPSSESQNVRKIPLDNGEFLYQYRPHIHSNINKDISS